MELKIPETKGAFWVRISCIVDLFFLALFRKRAEKLAFCGTVFLRRWIHITAWGMDSRKLAVSHELLQGLRCSMAREHTRRPTGCEDVDRLIEDRYILECSGRAEERKTGYAKFDESTTP